MSTFSRQRKQRLRDFEQRVRFDEDVRTYRQWRYVTVHPFADETELLARLEMQPEECRQADVWWHTGNDVVLLQTIAVGKEKQPTKAFWHGNKPYLSIVTHLPDTLVTIERLHEAMDRIVKCGLPRSPRRESPHGFTLFHW